MHVTEQGEEIHAGVKTSSRCHQKSKIGVSVVPQKGLR